MITEVLRLIAGIIAFVGVLSALLALQLERSKHLAILRAIGLTSKQLWSLVLNRRAFGWSMDFHLPPDVLAQALALAILASLLAGLYPAYKMARTAPAGALRGE